MLDEERERSDQLEKQIHDLKVQLQNERATCITLEQRLRGKVGTEELEEVGCLFNEDLTLSSAAPSDDLYTEEYEICEEREGTPQIQQKPLDYLIISTQSI